MGSSLLDLQFVLIHLLIGLSRSISSIFLLLHILFFIVIIQHELHIMQIVDEAQ